MAATKSPPNRTDVALALGILAGSAVLRCLGLGHREFWHDEYCSLLYATAPEGTLQALRAGGNPPLYFLLLGGWMRLFGSSEAAVRALSVVFSTASIAALGLWLRSLEMRRRAILWSMTLAAVAPLHLFYASEARGYALVLLLVGLSLWTFTEALRCGASARRSSRARAVEGTGWWALHGLVCALSFYTHNLLVPLTAAFWLAAWVQRADRRAWRSMLVTHAVALALFAPWIATLAGQAASGQERWIVKFWQGYPPALAIPRSLLAFGVGGPIPIIIAWPSPAAGIVWLSGAWFAVVAFFAFSFGWRSEADRRALGTLLVFLLFPLIGLWLVSALVRPLYVVGRYDLPALPAFLGLMGMGIDGLQRSPLGLRGRRALVPSFLAPVILVTILAVGGYIPRWRTIAEPDARPNRRRADLLARVVRPVDLLVAHDLAASNVLFLTREREIAAPLVTFPAEILGHWGWFNADESLQRGRETLVLEAIAVLENQRKGHPDGRVWLLPHLKSLSRPGRPHAGNAHQELLDVFLEACRREKMVLSYPPGADAQNYGRVGIIPLAFVY